MLVREVLRLAPLLKSLLSSLRMFEASIDPGNRDEAIDISLFRFCLKAS